VLERSIAVMTTDLLKLAFGSRLEYSMKTFRKMFRVSPVGNVE
jgi:hypothetical protein